MAVYDNEGEGFNDGQVAATSALADRIYDLVTSIYPTPTYAALVTIMLALAVCEEFFRAAERAELEEMRKSNPTNSQSPDRESSEGQ